MQKTHPTGCPLLTPHSCAHPLHGATQSTHGAHPAHTTTTSSCSFLYPSLFTSPLEPGPGFPWATLNLARPIHQCNSPSPTTATTTTTTHSSTVPSTTSVALWPGMDTGFPAESNRPMRGPTSHAPISPVSPPTMCTTPACSEWVSGSG